MGGFAASIGVPTLAGPFILVAAAFILAGLVHLFFLRPDPLLVANGLASVKSVEKEDLSIVNTSDTQRKEGRGIIVGTTLMILTQMVMVGIMTMTPVHMRHHGHGLSEVGMIISIHVAFMYLPSFMTGILIDKIGRTAMAIAAGATLLAAGIFAAMAPADSMLFLIIALALLGLGWNFGLICGTALIVDATLPSTRAKTQGTVDVLIALAGATGGALSGVVVAQSSYATLSLAGGFVSLLLIPVVVWFRRKV